MTAETIRHVHKMEEAPSAVKPLACDEWTCHAFLCSGVSGGFVVVRDIMKWTFLFKFAHLTDAENTVRSNIIGLFTDVTGKPSEWCDADYVCYRFFSGLQGRGGHYLRPELADHMVRLCSVRLQTRSAALWFLPGLSSAHGRLLCRCGKMDLLFILPDIEAAQHFKLFCSCKRKERHHCT